MNDLDALKICLSKIEEKLQWGNCILWHTSQYQDLSQIIDKETNTTISSRTLMRLFRNEVSDNYNPQSATKDALAMFVGYNDWSDFKTRVNAASSDVSRNNYRKRKLYLNSMILIMAVLFLAFLLYVFFIRINPKDIVFKTVTSEGDAPLTVNFIYDIEGIPFRKFYFQSGVYGSSYQLDKSNHLYNYAFLTPGYYESVIKSANKILKKIPILVKSQGWESFIGYDYNKAKPIPFSNYKFQHQYGVMHVNTLDIVNRKVDTLQMFWVKYILVKDFGKSADGFIVETKIKNSIGDGGLKCNDLIFDVITSSNAFKVHIVNKGCSYFVKLNISEKIFNGEAYNLEQFGQNLEEWGVLKIENRDKKVDIFYNDKKLLSVPYNESLGNLLGFSYQFKGCGMVDYIHYSDVNNNPIYIEEFTD